MIPPFQSFLEEHADAVYRFLLSATGREGADDCFQETFLAALRAYPALRDGSNLRGWALTIAGNKARDWHRSRSRAPRATEKLPEIPVLDTRDFEPSLWAAVRALPDKQRAAVVYRFVNDLPYADIGQIIGSSEAAARQNVREGLKKIREVWI